jgi:hypothetical protein
MKSSRTCTHWISAAPEVDYGCFFFFSQRVGAWSAQVTDERTAERGILD